MKLKMSLLPLLMFIPVLLRAESPDYASWIGMTPAEAFEAFGVPSDIYVLRGERPEEDDVVFYRDGVYLFWFENRVWQVRADKTSGIALGGVSIGDTKESVVAALKEPLHQEQESLFFELRRGAYPLRLRVVFGETGLVEDLYLYRGDY